MAVEGVSRHTRHCHRDRARQKFAARKQHQFGYPVMLCELRMFPDVMVGDRRATYALAGLEVDL